MLLLALLTLSVGKASAQSLGVRYLWVDTLHVSTSAIDTTFDVAWEMATIYADTVDVNLVLGAPDVGSWTSRNPMLLQTGMSFVVGPSPQLTRVEAWTDNGAGVLYIVGYKKERQY